MPSGRCSTGPPRSSAAGGGTVGQVDRWGKRRFAYELNHQLEGFYVLIEATAEPAAMAELDRMLSPRGRGDPPQGDPPARQGRRPGPSRPARRRRRPPAEAGSEANGA